MNKSSRSFHNDTRNAGGRQNVIETMLSHQAKLREITAGGQSTLSSSPSSSQSLSFTSSPSTYHLISSLSVQRQRKKSRTLNEQEKKDMNMLRRMEEYPLKGQRRQNEQDWQAHPVKLFRERSVKDVLAASSSSASEEQQHSFLQSTQSRHRIATTSQVKMASSSRPTSAKPMSKTTALLRADRPQSAAVRSRPRGSPPPPAVGTSSSNKKKSSSSSLTTAASTSSLNNRDGSWRPLSASQSAASMKSSLSRSQSSSSHVSHHHTQQQQQPPNPYTEHAVATVNAMYDPHVQAAQQAQLDPYSHLKSKLFSLIVEHRIYRASAIVKLLDKAKKMNTHLNRDRLKNVLDELKVEFDVPLEMEAEEVNEMQHHSSKPRPTGEYLQEESLRLQKDHARSYERDRIAAEQRIEKKERRLEETKERIGMEGKERREKEKVRQQQQQQHSRHGRSRSRSASRSSRSSRSRSSSESRSRSRSASRSRSNSSRRQ